MANRKNDKRPVYRIPGPDTLQQFLKDNAALFNAAELERLCKFSSGRMRYIVNNGRTARKLSKEEYDKLREVLLPRLTELVLLMILPDTLDQD
jgi:hypothetical protein